LAGGATDPLDFIDLDAALDELGRLNPRQAQLVELRYFGGLENSEIATILGVSEPTLVRDWRIARVWLFDRLHSPARQQ
jgi:DNA-directed RNA polymerase specialized sigma24 family protein